MIYCIEGVHLTEEEIGKGETEPTVEPMLALLRRSGYWNGYLHRTCATMDELRYRLLNEWQGFPYGSILYFSTHGAPNQIWLRPETEVVQIQMIGAWEVDLTDCHVHFGGCDTFGKGSGDLRELMDATRASSVSGYAAESDWLTGPPAVALELVLFALLSEVDLAANDGRDTELKRINTQINKRLPDCHFRMLVR